MRVSPFPPLALLPGLLCALVLLAPQVAQAYLSPYDVFGGSAITTVSSSASSSRSSSSPFSVPLPFGTGTSSIASSSASSPSSSSSSSSTSVTSTVTIITHPAAGTVATSSLSPIWYAEPGPIVRQPSADIPAAPNDVVNVTPISSTAPQVTATGPADVLALVLAVLAAVVTVAIALRSDQLHSLLSR